MTAQIGTSLLGDPFWLLKNQCKQTNPFLLFSPYTAETIKVSVDFCSTPKPAGTPWIKGLDRYFKEDIFCRVSTPKRGLYSGEESGLKAINGRTELVTVV